MKLTEAPPSTQSISTSDRARISRSARLSRRRISIVSGTSGPRGTWRAVTYRRQALPDQLFRARRIRLAARSRVQLIQQLRLQSPATQRLGVRDLRVEHHHRVARNETIGKAPLQPQ